MDLKDKRALITGGTSGMGIATALAMAEKGATVIITGRDETRGAGTAEEIRAGGHDAQFIAADFSELSEVGRVADAAGEIDVLVNRAGVAAMGATADTDEAALGHQRARAFEGACRGRDPDAAFRPLHLLSRQGTAGKAVRTRPLGASRSAARRCASIHRW